MRMSKLPSCQRLFATKLSEYLRAGLGFNRPHVLKLRIPLQQNQQGSVPTPPEGVGTPPDLLDVDAKKEHPEFLGFFKKKFKLDG